MSVIPFDRYNVILTVNRDITFMPPQHHTRTGLGRPLPSVEIKLVTAADEGVGRWRSLYRGRIFIRGPSLTNPGAVRKRTGINIDLTLPSSSSNEDEWIETHRIGEWNASRKSFRVIGNLLEPLTARYLGDYIPIERLELVYKKRPYVTECILFHSWKSTRLISIICECTRQPLACES